MQQYKQPRATTFLVPVDDETIPMRSIPVIRPEYPLEVTLSDVRVLDENVLGEVSGCLSIAK